MRATPITTLTGIIAIALALHGCDADDDDDDDDDPAPATTAASHGGAQDSGGGDRVCGIVDPSLSDCDACAAQMCCDIATECGDDHDCNACYFTLEKPLECYDNPAFAAFADCVNGPCQLACAQGGGSADGGSGSSNACTDIACGYGDTASKVCHDNGCGDCSFGKCLLF